MLEKLRKFGKFGILVANFLEFLWSAQGIGLTIAAIGVFAMNIWSSIIGWLNQPEIYIPAIFFLFFLWTYIGILTLLNQRKPRLVKAIYDYTYSFICDGGIQANLVKFPSNHHENPDEDAIVVTALIRNVGAGPARLYVEDIRVILDQRTAADSPPIEVNFARMAQKGIRSGPIVRDASKNHLSGTLSCKFLYGPPDQDFVRRYILKTKIDVYIDMDKDRILVDNSIIEEKDEPYVAG